MHEMIVRFYRKINQFDNETQPFKFGIIDYALPSRFDGQFQQCDTETITTMNECDFRIVGWVESGRNSITVEAEKIQRRSVAIP
jgi:hypothetical protein